MTTTTTDILTGQQSVLVDRIKIYHTGVRHSFEQQAQYAFLTGIALHALKDTCDHGNAKNGEGFIAIREKFLPDISRSAASRYMEFTRLLSEKDPTVGSISCAALSAQNGELPEKDKKKVMAAVSEAMDGKSWTAMYRDLSFIREKKDVGRKPGETPKKLSIAEQAALLQELAAKDWAAIDRGLWVYEHKFTALSDEDVMAQEARLEQALKARRAWRKQPPTKRDPEAIKAMLASV